MPYYTIPGFTDLGDQMSARNMAVRGGGFYAYYDRLVTSAMMGVSPEAFGARGDGFHDDTTALQAALDAISRADQAYPGLSGATAGVLYLSARKTYKISAPLTCSSSVHIRGDGLTTVLKPTGYDATTGQATSVFVFNGATEVVAEDFLIDGGSMVAPRMASVYGSNPSDQKTLYVYPGFSIQAGDDIYIGDPTFRQDVAWELNQVASIDGIVSTGAYKVTLVNNLAHTYGDRTRVAQKQNGYGGHGLSFTNVARVRAKGLYFSNILTTCLDVNQVSDLLVDGCEFDGFTSAQANSCYFAARGFGVGGWDVSRGRFVNNVVKNVPGRRTAGVEIRTTETSHGSQGPDILDWVIEGNHFIQIGSQTDIYNSHGSCVNIIAGRNPVDVRRVIINGNTSYGIGDGHYWIGAPGGEVIATNNVMEKSLSGPHLNINAPYAVVSDNVISWGGLTGIEIDAISTGDYAVGTPGHLNLRGITVTGNVITGLIHAQSGVGINITTSTGQGITAAEAPRSIIIADNFIQGCWQDGIHLTNPAGKINIHDNIILDVNQGNLASTQLNGASVSATGQQQVTVDDTSHFVPIGFCQMGGTALGSTTLNGAVAAGATSFTLTNAAAIPAVIGHALWLGTEEANTAEIVVPTNVVGNVISCAPLELAHSNGVNVSPTYRPQIVSIDSPTQMTLQYNQGVWADNTVLNSPFPGSAGIAITGNATFPGARISIHDNIIGIEDVPGSTQYGVLLGAGVTGPFRIKDNDFINCVQGDVRDVPTTAATLQDSPYRGAWGTDDSLTTYRRKMLKDWTWVKTALNVATTGPGLGETVIRTSDLNGLGWLTTDSVTIGTLTTTINGAPVNNGDGTYTITLTAGLDADRANGTTITNNTRSNSATISGLAIGGTIFTLNSVANLVVGNMMWIDGTNTSGSDFARISAISGLRVTIASALTFLHANGIAVYPSALPGRLTIAGPTWDQTNYGAFESFYDPSLGTWRVGLTRTAGTVPSADMQIRNDMGGAIRIMPASLNAWQFNTSGHFIPNLSDTYNIGSVTNFVNALYARWPTTAYSSANPAISVIPGYALLTRNGNQAATIVNPTATTHDGLTITIVSADQTSVGTGHAHTVTNSPTGFNSGGGASDVATFTNAGDSFTIMAYQGVWYVIDLRGVTLG